MDSKLVQKAVRFAVELHNGQTRKILPRFLRTSLPFIIHPLTVARYVGFMMGLEYEVAAAVLHDVLEDTSATPELILDDFGPRILGLVEAVTSDKKLSWRERKEAQAKLIRETEELPIIRLKLADLLDNARSLTEIPDLPSDRTFRALGFRRGTEDTLWSFKIRFDALSERVQHMDHDTLRYFILFAEEMEKLRLLLGRRSP
jgi:myo-inositol-1(or 4)-monophosphatase